MFKPLDKNFRMSIGVSNTKYYVPCYMLDMGDNTTLVVGVPTKDGVCKCFGGRETPKEKAKMCLVKKSPNGDCYIKSCNPILCGEFDYLTEFMPNKKSKSKPNEGCFFAWINDQNKVVVWNPTMNLSSNKEVKDVDAQCIAGLLNKYVVALSPTGEKIGIYHISTSNISFIECSAMKAIISSGFYVFGLNDKVLTIFEFKNLSRGLTVIKQGLSLNISKTEEANSELFISRALRRGEEHYFAVGKANTVYVYGINPEKGCNIFRGQLQIKTEAMKKAKSSCEVSCLTMFTNSGKLYILVGCNNGYIICMVAIRSNQVIKFVEQQIIVGCVQKGTPVTHIYVEGNGRVIGMGKGGYASSWQLKI